MDLATIEPALVTLAAKLTGVPAAACVWENAGRPMAAPGGLTVLLSWVSRTGVGQDGTAWAFEAGPDPLVEMVPTTHGSRAARWQLAVEVTTDQRPGYNAASIIERARTRLAWPSSLAALEAVELALAEVGTATQADYPADGRMVSRSLFEVALNGVANEADADGRTNYIDTVEVTATVQNAAGADLPSTVQPSLAG